MASSSSGASKLNVKRGRKKKINQNSSVLEDFVRMEVDSVGDASIDQESTMKMDNLVEETNINNEKPADEDTFDATDMLTGETDKQTDNNMSILSTTEMLGISESVTQSLGSSEFPIDVELAADFEDIGGDSLCDISMNTVFDVNADWSNMDMSATSNDFEKAENVTPVVQDAVVDEDPGASAESSMHNTAGEDRIRSAEGGEVQGDDVTEVEAGEVSTLRECGQVKSDAEQTSIVVEPVKHRPGGPKRKASVSCAAEGDEIEGDDITEVEAGGEMSTLHKETNRTKPVRVKGRRGRPRKKRKGRTEVEGGEGNESDQVKRVKRGRGRPKTERTECPVEIPSPKLTVEELRAEIRKLLPQEGEATFSQDSRTKMRALLKEAKLLPCPRCKRVYKVFNGYEYHVVRCGVAVHLECEHCGQTYTTKDGLAYHVRAAHRKPVLVEVEEPEAEPVSSKSKYSQRQRSQPHRYCGKDDQPPSDDNGSASTESSFEVEEDKPCTKNKTWTKYMERLEPEPAAPEQRTTTRQYNNMTEISAALKERSILKCPKKCGRQFRHAVRFYHHVQKCTGVTRQKYRCTFCGKELQTVPGMKLHIVSEHRRKRHNSENGEESEFSGGEKPQKVKKRLKASFGPKSVDFRDKTKAWYESLCGEPVLTCWRPSLKHWKRLPASEAEHYLPVRKMSPVFKIEPALDKPDQDTEFELPLFSSVPISPVGDLHSITFNVGGPVWAMDWAPVPVDKEKCDQYLAIGCHRDSDENHLISECYKEKGVLQIWRLPKLRNGKRPTKQPEFCLGIVHDYGPLWDVRWCPSGTWESSAQAGELRRLGLLALACADGKVRIFSVPFPCSLLENIGDEALGKSPEDLLFRATPHAVLSPGSLCRKYKEECGAAWAVSWQPISGHKKVTASYADGTVAIWSLTTDNRVLKASTPDGLTECIFPTSHFQAHNSVIRSLAWCPSEPNYIATGGYDKLIKIWDLRHTSQPVMTYKKAWTYSITWPLHFALLIYSIDVDMARLRGTRFFDYYQSSRDEKAVSHVSRCYVSHNSTAWDNDYSNWINVVASVDAAGVVSMNFLSEGFFQQKTRAKKPIFRAFVEPVVECEDTANSAEKKDKFKIIFKDVQPLNATKAERDFLANDTAYVPPDQPTRVALQKVRWNPNLSSYFWLATAGKCGLVRLCYVDQLQ